MSSFCRGSTMLTPALCSSRSTKVRGRGECGRVRASERGRLSAVCACPCTELTHVWVRFPGTAATATAPPSLPPRLFPSALCGVQFKGLPCDDSGQITAQGLEFLQLGASLRALERLAPSGVSGARSAGVLNPAGSGESQQRPATGEFKRDACLQECLWRCEEVLTQLQRQHHHLSPACQTRVLSLAPSELEREEEAQQLVRLRVPHFFCADLDASMSVSESHAADADRLQVPVLFLRPSVSLAIAAMRATWPECYPIFQIGHYYQSSD